MRRCLIIVALFALAGMQLPAEAPTPALSPRNANYTIDVEFDPTTRTLVGRQRLMWRNIQTEPTDELWFHQYWNGWRNTQSTWMIEDRLRGRSDLEPGQAREEDWGWLEVDSVTLADAAEQLPARYEAPDDGNAEDRTVWVVSLPQPVAPGDSIELDLEWRAKIPRTFARTGYRGDFYFFAHWFPKLGVYQQDGSWNNHQYHAGTEYFSDYGVYDVRITTPEEYEVGATGRELTRTQESGRITRRFLQEDVHAFTWTASPDYLEHLDRFEHPDLPPVDIRFLYQPEHAHQVERHIDATKAALERYGLWYGPYPYGHVTVIDPAWGSGAAGMEYPTIFTCGTGIHRPFGGGSPEGVTVHEAGHQFWYGVVGNNEFEHAWIDEGFNTYSTTRTMLDRYGPSFRTRGYLSPPGARSVYQLAFPELLRDAWSDRLSGYARNAASDVPSTPSYEYHPGTGGSLSYSKTMLWLYTLENYLGWERQQQVLSTFYERFSFRHPSPDDFFAVANEVSGEDLSWFFDQVHHSAVTFDFAIDSVNSRAVGVEGFVTSDEGGLLYVNSADEKGDDDPESWISEVVVRRLGEGIFPVTVRLVFDDGSVIDRKWDGRDRWILIRETHASKLKHAIVDPDRKLVLDVHPANNSMTRRSAPPTAANKWASFWMIWMQDRLAGWAAYL